MGSISSTSEPSNPFCLGHYQAQRLPLIYASSPWIALLKLKKKKVFFPGKAGVPAIMTIADHNKCTTNLPSKEIKDYGKEERGTNLLNHIDHAKQSPHFAASDPQARRGEVTAHLPATE